MAVARLRLREGVADAVSSLEGDCELLATVVILAVMFAVSVSVAVADRLPADCVGSSGLTVGETVPDPPAPSPSDTDVVTVAVAVALKDAEADAVRLLALVDGVAWETLPDREPLSLGVAVGCDGVGDTSVGDAVDGKVWLGVGGTVAVGVPEPEREPMGVWLAVRVGSCVGVPAPSAKVPSSKKAATRGRRMRGSTVAPDIVRCCSGASTTTRRQQGLPIGNMTRKTETTTATCVDGDLQTGGLSRPTGRQTGGGLLLRRRRRR